MTRWLSILYCLSLSKWKRCFRYCYVSVGNLLPRRQFGEIPKPHLGKWSIRGMCHVHLTNCVGRKWWRYLIPSDDRSGVAPREHRLRRAGRPRRHLHIIRYSRRLPPRRRTIPHSGRKISYPGRSKTRSGRKTYWRLFQIRHRNNGIACLTHKGFLLTYVQSLHKYRMYFCMCSEYIQIVKKYVYEYLFFCVQQDDHLTQSRYYWWSVNLMHSWLKQEITNIT